MSRFDQDTSTMRMRMENTLIELRKPELGPQSKARGILVGALLGALAWAAIITLSPGHGRGGAREKLTTNGPSSKAVGSSRSARAALHMLDKPGVIGRAAQEGD